MSDPMPADQVSVRLRVNGALTDATVPARLLLSDFLRHELKLTGTHVGCEQGICGACTILLNGSSVRSCLILAAQCDAADIETIEGLSASGRAAAIQEEFSKHRGLQCGFCTPGFIVGITELAEMTPGELTDAELRRRLSGHLCRCTGYAGIIAATKAVLKARLNDQPGQPTAEASP